MCLDEKYSRMYIMRRTKTFSEDLQTWFMYLCKAGKSHRDIFHPRFTFWGQNEILQVCVFRKVAWGLKSWIFINPQIQNLSSSGESLLLLLLSDGMAIYHIWWQKFSAEHSKMNPDVSDKDLQKSQSNICRYIHYIKKTECVHGKTAKLLSTKNCCCTLNIHK